jgi:hypothetical protein
MKAQMYRDNNNDRIQRQFLNSDEDTISTKDDTGLATSQGWRSEEDHDPYWEEQSRIFNGGMKNARVWEEEDRFDQLTIHSNEKRKSEEDPYYSNTGWPQNEGVFESPTYPE